MDKEKIEKGFMVVYEVSSKVLLLAVSSLVKAMGKIEYQLRNSLREYTERWRDFKKSCGEK